MQSVEKGKDSLIDNIKTLLYRERDDIFNTLSFEDDFIYQEPLFFAYFKDRNRHKEYLDLIIFGYCNDEKFVVKVETDKYRRIYVPNIGWLITDQADKSFDLSKNKNLHLKCKKGNICDFEHEAIHYIDETNIELLKYPVALLEQFYYDEHLNRIDVEIEQITKKHEGHLTKAIHLIKKFVPHHYELIESVTKKMVIFNVDDNLRNSFATLSAQGIAFFNACQESYNEVFFVDDVAHQTGHIIFNALIYDIDEFLNVEPSHVVQELRNDEGVTVETRDIHVVFHALYTYYTTFICLDAMLENKVFQGEKLHELLGRMKFYIGKCFLDLKVIDNPYTGDYKSNQLFTKKGLQIYSAVKDKHQEMSEKWMPKIHKFKLDNQLYNFSYERFKELNPIN